MLGGSTLHPYNILFVDMPRPRKWSDEQLIEAVKVSTSYRNVCRMLGLTLLCPNCHALTPTYRGKNKGNKLIKPPG